MYSAILQMANDQAIRWKDEDKFALIIGNTLNYVQESGVLFDLIELFKTKRSFSAL